MLRPEGFEISPGGPGGDATWPSLDATVEQVVFVGSALEVRARLEEGTAVIAFGRARLKLVSDLQQPSAELFEKAP